MSRLFRNRLPTFPVPDEKDCVCMLSFAISAVLLVRSKGIRGALSENKPEQEDDG